MADPNHIESMDQIHSSEQDTDALENKINESDESTTAPDDYAAMRHEQERLRQVILQRKSEIERNNWSDLKG
ncbi:hypothetical protein HDF14_005373 [Edaphobacter lichenicola]|uniref:Uncharacterized protein n=1 Tax=Tunturiibacter gelidiferens TaxID=3069689 RepID=A0A9X0QKC1_9BACT|nr:hypothetical protein [Edaphobacter lichenicola]